MISAPQDRLLRDSFERGGENVGNGHSFGRSQWAVMGGNGATVLVGGVRGVLLLSKELGISGFLRLLPKEWGGGTKWGRRWSHLRKVG